jgi:transcription-repair coupling factor (superfamily II helicase)
LNLYARRSQMTRPPFSQPDDSYRKFEALFPYDETEDQMHAINDVLSDFESDHPMDRLICGDVGFGKTEVALRAAFKAAQDGKQVALLVPTTVLAFQHLETFRARFRGLPYSIAGFNRFTPKSEINSSLAKLKTGEVSIAIGTHRLLSKDIEFKNLGLLIIDEEQKFGVTHKEKIRKLRANVDTLTLSATPIPRTLNMSMVGIRDLSLITTAPRDRLPIRTYICKFEQETIRKAILSEIARGGQIFYVHNRVQTINGLADELRSLVPEARIRIGHGQMTEGELEDTMVAFFKHEFDVLLCTTIIESGVDIPRANTMIVDRADTFGLSQLYQLRGRIGRSKDRAYCYLLLPKNGLIDPEAQERLKVLQENSSLGSGIRIAQHDLELRGAGNILGEEQSGHINAVGYELYFELLDEALKEVRGQPVEDMDVEPDINLRIPALIPDAYIPDIRIRLGFYKQLSQITAIGDIDRIEDDLRDQFGAPPEPVLNLLGVMIIRRLCKDLGVRDISSGTKSVSLAFSDKTKVAPQTVLDLVMREKKKYSLTPDSRLIVKMESQSWPEIYEELEKLKKLARLI